MIETHSIRNLQYDKFDYIWVIIRGNMPAGLEKVPNAVKVPVLSPCWPLFTTYRKLVEEHNWNQTTFNTIYKPRFIAQIQNEDKLPVEARFATHALQNLVRMDKEGKRIALVCFCADKNMCHRSIIAEMLQNMGANVICN